MKKTYVLDGLCCANCAAKMEKGIAKLEGVESAAISFLAGKLVVETAGEVPADLIRQIEKVVKKVDSDVEVQEK